MKKLMILILFAIFVLASVNVSAVDCNYICQHAAIPNLISCNPQVLCLTDAGEGEYGDCPNECPTCINSSTSGNNGCCCTETFPSPPPGGGGGGGGGNRPRGGCLATYYCSEPSRFCDAIGWTGTVTREKPNYLNIPVFQPCPEHYYRDGDLLRKYEDGVSWNMLEEDCCGILIQKPVFICPIECIDYCNAQKYPSFWNDLTLKQILAEITVKLNILELVEESPLLQYILTEPPTCEEGDCFVEEEITWLSFGNPQHSECEDVCDECKLEIDLPLEPTMPGLWYSHVAREFK